MIKRILDKIAGDYNQKQIDKLLSIVDEINKFDAQRDSKTDEEIKNKTIEFKERIQRGQSLDSILPEAFAAVKQACKRMKGKDFEVKGNFQRWEMVPYDVQLLGGVILHKGKIAEMKTGEGKTLVATLPAYLNALEGKGVHVVTVNDYLASRDAQWMSHLYNWLGLSCGYVTKGVNIQQRKEEYSKDITYVENSELGFDYLRDNLTKSLDERNLVWRPLNYAIIDEVDSILIDEARTPLIISQPSQEATDKYVYYSQISKLLVPCKGKKKSPKGLLKELLTNPEDEIVDEGDYYIDEKTKSVTLSSFGIQKLEKLLNVENLYKDLGYGEIHHIENALRAQAVYHKDKDYLINAGEVLIVDEHTGRTMPGRRYSEGLHQAIEAKEQVTVQRESKTLATITYQHFFKQYNKLSGMTGTATTEGEEFEKIYELEVLAIPTHNEVIRVDKNDKVFFNQNAKWNAVMNNIKFYNEMGVPILIGTSSINTSEYVSDLLRKISVQHYVLNAKFHQQEAEIISNAGKIGSVVVATNMAGRGTDIKLDKDLLSITGDNYVKWIRKNVKYNEFTKAKAKDLEIIIYSKLEYGIIKDKLIKEFDITQELLEQAQTETVELIKDQATLSVSINNNKKSKEDYYVKLIINSLDSEKEEQPLEVEFHFGLYILGTEKHDSRRIDNQLRGRAGRQGDPGFSQFFVSLDDEIMKKMGGDKIQGMVSMLMKKEDLESMDLTQKQFTNSIERAQKQMEGWHFGTRKHLFDYDSVINIQRTNIYKKRDNLILGKTNLQEGELLSEIKGFISPVVSKLVDSYATMRPWNEGELIETILQFSGHSFKEEEILKFNSSDNLADYITIKLGKMFDEKFADLDLEKINIVLKDAYLGIIDKYWVNHIDDLQYLRDQVALYGYAQENPLIKYKHEAYSKFQKLLFNIKLEMLSISMKNDFSVVTTQDEDSNRIMISMNKENNIDKILAAVVKNITKDDINNAQKKTIELTKAKQEDEKSNQDDGIEIIEVNDEPQKSTIIHKNKSKKPGPNDPCFCGSGKKFKKCCGIK
ncbi:MAG: preprotein translocase subunit SecA [Candidatus Absconditabacteria bacterium]